ncbi:MAG: S41 family peptidase [Acidobacteriota bacterium]
MSEKPTWKTAVLLAAGLALAATSWAVDEPSGDDGPSAAADLRDAVAWIEAVHPAPYRHVSKEALAAATDAEAERLGALAEATDIDLGLSLRRVLAPVGDFHLALGLPSFQPGAEVSPRLLPLLPLAVGERVYVDASLPELPAGTELLTLDGRSIPTVLDALASLAWIDGPAHDEARLAVRRARAVRKFGGLHLLAFGASERYVARVRLPGGEEREVELKSVDPAAAAALHRERRSIGRWGTRPDDGPPWPALERLAESTYLLRLPSFGIPDQDGYRNRVDAIFDGLDRRARLILDLRGNEGGLRTHGIAVLEHLLRGRYAQWTSLATRVRGIPEPWRGRVTFPFTPPDVLETVPGTLRGDRYVFDGDPLAERMRGKGRRHRGPVAVLVDDATNSAAVEMVVALLAKRPEVRVVGTETGGGCARHVGEIPALLATPNLGVRLMASLVEITHVESRGCTPGRGVVPDLPVPFTKADALGGGDPFLAALGDWIR